MAGKLTAVMASRVLGGTGLVGRSASSSVLRTRSGLGLPVGRHIVPEKTVSPILSILSSISFLIFS